MDGFPWPAGQGHSWGQGLRPHGGVRRHWAGSAAGRGQEGAQRFTRQRVWTRQPWASPPFTVVSVAGAAPG